MYNLFYLKSRHIYIPTLSLQNWHLINQTHAHVNNQIRCLISLSYLPQVVYDNLKSGESRIKHIVQLMQNYIIFELNIAFVKSNSYNAIKVFNLFAIILINHEVAIVAKLQKVIVFGKDSKHNYAIQTIIQSQ